MLGLGLVSFTIGVDVKVSAASAAGQVHSTTITVPPQQFDTPYSAGSGSLSLASGSVTRTGLTVSANLLGIPVTLPTATVDSILSAVVSTVVTPLVNQLDDGVVKPLANLTGTRIAGADVIALSKLLRARAAPAAPWGLPPAAPHPRGYWCRDLWITRPRRDSPLRKAPSIAVPRCFS